MITEFKLPGLGENIKSGVATKIMVKAGDSVTKDQPVLELETDKAVLEVPSPVSGTVKEILVKTNQEIKVGQVIMKIDSLSEKQLPAKEEVFTKQEALKKEPVSKTPPSAAPIPAPSKEPSAAPAFIEAEFSSEILNVPAAPSVRKFAREIGIDIQRVPGSSPTGRISIEDVKAYAKHINTSLLSGMPAGLPAAGPLPDFSRFGTIERQPLNMVRKKTAEHLSRAWTTIPHVTQLDKADITELEKVRKKFSAKVEAKGGKLTVTPFILKVLAGALKNFPQLNASIDMATNEVIYKKYYNIGVAVDTDRGLIVPVIRGIDKKNILDIAVELNQMAERARNKKTTIEEMQGNSFTVTNLGGIGGTSFTPIVNSPDVAILGISRASLEPVYMDGNFTARLMLPLCLSYDHRLIDGALGARFLRWVAEALQQPFLIELEE